MKSPLRPAVLLLLFWIVGLTHPDFLLRPRPRGQGQRRLKKHSVQTYPS